MVLIFWMKNIYLKNEESRVIGLHICTVEEKTSEIYHFVFFGL